MEDDRLGIATYLVETQSVMLSSADRLRRSQSALKKAARDYARDGEQLVAVMALLRRLDGRPMSG